MYEAITGAVIMACLVAGLFFLRFWKKTHDRLFLFFAMAFWILAANRFTLIFIDEGNEDTHIMLYVVRLVAFSLILYAIIDKNRSKKPHN
jgi:hypothetical protein